MLSNLTNGLLVLTAFAPVLLTYSFVLYRQDAGITAVASLLGAAALLVVLCWGVLLLAQKRLPAFEPFRATAVKPADRELLTYVIAYLLPLVNATTPNVDSWVLVFVVGLLVAIAWATHAYHFNPLIALFGFHFYEVTSDDGMTYIMLSNRNLTAVSDLTRVRQLGPYVLMDASVRERGQ